MSVAALHHAVIEDLIRSLKPEFAFENLDESVLVRLQQLWEQRLNQEANAAPHQDDLFAANNGAPVSHAAVPMPRNELSGFYLPAVQSHSAAVVALPAPPLPASSNNASTGGSEESLLGMPASYMPTPSWKAANSSSKHTISLEATGAPPVKRPTTLSRAVGRQTDGLDDDDDDDDVEDDEEEPSRAGAPPAPHAMPAKVGQPLIAAPALAAPAVAVAGDLGDGLEEKLLDPTDVNDPNLDDDDRQIEMNNLVLCQWDKVTRVKNKRKLSIKLGMMYLNGKDYVFQKGFCEVDW